MYFDLILLGCKTTGSVLFGVDYALSGRLHFIYVRNFCDNVVVWEVLNIDLDIQNDEQVEFLSVVLQEMENLVFFQVKQHPHVRPGSLL